MKFDLGIVGAGPAGLAAAIEARQAGLSVVVLDEQSAPGGQIYRQVERVTGTELSRAAMLGPDYGRGADLVRAFRACGARYVPGASVWHIEPSRLHYIEGEVVGSVEAERILLATGAIERPMARPGWTLPGVVTAGAAQIMLKTSGLIPSSDVVLVGNGPLLYLLASQVLRAGGTIQALVETVPVRRYLAAAPYLPAAFGAGYVGKGLSMLLDLVRRGVPVYRGASEVEMLGSQAVGAVRFRCGPRSVTIETESVVLHEGVIPNQQITQLVNCVHHWDSNQQCFVPTCDEWGNSSVAGLMLAGDGAGIGGAFAAEAAGRLAALEAACALGRLPSAERDSRATLHRRRRKALVRGRRFLEILYAPSDLTPEIDTTIVCRCEEVTAGQIRRAVAGGSLWANQVKSLLRCGMGPCQGRMCGATVSAIVADARGVSPDEAGYFRVRPPLKPIPLVALAKVRADGAET